jgi:hypothetical protein
VGYDDDAATSEPVIDDVAVTGGGRLAPPVHVGDLGAVDVDTGLAPA